MHTIRIACILCSVVACQAVVASGQLAYTGINIGNGSFANNYVYPNRDEIDYFVAKGMNVIRLPFLWERLQPNLNQTFSASEFAQIDAIVSYATSKGATVILDPHNYARYNGSLIGSSAVPHSAFADFWSRLATTYKTNSNVMFGLMNEPHHMPTEQWVTSANAAIAAIRNTSAQNLVLVPGNAWSGAHSWGSDWYGTPNAVAMLNIVDPADNYAFDIHQYLDSNNSGTTTGIVSKTIGRERLMYVTQWLKDNDLQGFLGEFAVANSTIGDGANQIGDEAINNMLAYMEANSDAWMGWSWWAAGPAWRDYMFTMEPTGLGTDNVIDQPSMTLVESHLASPHTPEPGSMLCVVTAFAVAAWRRPRRRTK